MMASVQKLQIPSSKLQRNTKLQAPNRTDGHKRANTGPLTTDHGTEKRKAESRNKQRTTKHAKYANRKCTIPSNNCAKVSQDWIICRIKGSCLKGWEVLNWP